MSYKKFSIIFVTILIIFLGFFIFSPITNSVEKDVRLWTTDINGNYVYDFEPGAIVYIWGSGFNPNSEIISLNITRPDREIEFAPDNPRFLDINFPLTDGNGNFSLYEYDLNGIAGEYIIKASDGTNFGITTFTDDTIDIVCQQTGDFSGGIAKYLCGDADPIEGGVDGIIVEWNECHSVSWSSNFDVCGIISFEGEAYFINEGGTSGSISEHSHSGISFIIFCYCEDNCIDYDNDGYYAFDPDNCPITDNVDCDDNDDTVYPGATEICDGIDNNCDGNIDEGELDTDQDGIADCVDTDDDNDNDGVLDGEDCASLDDTKWQILTGYIDADGDNYGTGSPIDFCTGATLPTGYVPNADDCDDTNEFINPDATEICDGIDNNCDGNIDEGDSTKMETAIQSAKEIVMIQMTQFTQEQSRYLMMV